MVIFAVELIAGDLTFAADNKSKAGAILGTMTDEKGKPFGGVEIHAKRVDVKGPEAVTLTNSHGHYVFKGLPVGAYSITAYVDGVAISRANVNTRGDGWAKVDFDLRLNAKGGDGADRLQQDLRFGDGNLNVRDNAKFGW